MANGLCRNLDKKTVIGLGFFDGLHIGHMELVHRVAKYSREHELFSIVYTFDVHPINVLQNANFEKLLMSNVQKERIITGEGVDCVLFDHFDKSLAAMSPREFVSEVLVWHFHVQHVVVGFNYNFGANGEGTVEDLIAFGNEFGFSVEVVPAIYADGELVSSTLIRKLLEEGCVSRVAKMLGRPFELFGTVSPGRKLGSKMKFPTANIYPETNLITPLKGVYASLVKLGDSETYRAVTNVGTNPTISSEDGVRVETHIFDFCEDIYGRSISVQFIELIRPEEKFPDIEALFAQISRDSEKARQILDGK